MVNELKIVPAALLALLAVCGCVSVKGDRTLVPPSGLYAHFRAPLFVNRAAVPCDGLKSGTSSASVYIKEWVYSGISAEVCDMTLRDAVANGGLKKVYFADYEQRTFFGFVTVFTVTAHGE